MGVDDFRFLGGFPDQCIMEDYVLIDLLRHRGLLGISSGLEVLEERSECDNRRWKINGVRKVASTNRKVVKCYEDIGAKGCFEMYYGIKWEGVEGREREIEELF